LYDISPVIEILFPPSGFIEEIRKLALLGNFNLNVLVLAVIVSVIYLLIGYALFTYQYNKGRKEGWIYLR